MENATLVTNYRWNFSTTYLFSAAWTEKNDYCL